MKSSKKSQVPEKNVNPETQKRRADVRDNLDHREGEEQDNKGSNMTTHNKKEHHTPPKKK